ncbi:MAG TPA: DNA repair protein RadA [Candidatus Limnocylindrales bacterium]|nr:DNA repair protein RadA [Candidatus Limnocylindrales bacterium]
MTRAAAKSSSRYVCQSCGEAFLRWEGQCRNCGSWNSLVETVVREPRRGGSSPGSSPDAGRAAAAPLATVPEPDVPRRPFGIGELDRVLGGGIVVGSIVLVGGEPGIGKSTLLLQAAAGATAAGATVLYATGEESAAQVRLRADRLGLLGGPAGTAIHVAADSEVGRIAELVRAERPTLVIVDSIQTSTVDDLDGPAGSVGQVRESALRLAELAKSESVAVVLVGHVTKDGSLAGPKTLEHLVDAVLSLEGERFSALRIVRASKNRFGSTEEVGVFEMGPDGLAELDDPARAFLADGDHGERGAPGSVVAPTLEGSRPILVEVQALVAPGVVGTPRRTANGVDQNRVALLIAVLGRRAGIGLGSHDVYVNLAGGLSVEEPALDLPIALALASSLRDRPIRSGTVAVGEIGLLGELRPVPGLDRRLREAARLGFTRAIVPAGNHRGVASNAGPEVGGLEVVRAETLRDAISAALDPAAERMSGSPARC